MTTRRDFAIDRLLELARQSLKVRSDINADSSYPILENVKTLAQQYANLVKQIAEIEA